MVQKFFLALDYETADEAVTRALAALTFLRDKFGDDFVASRVGIKVNEDLLTGTIDPRLGELPDLFADMKICHGADTGERIIGRLAESLPNMHYVTVSAGLGPTILRKYVDIARKYGTEVIAFTVHTKIPAPEVARMYGGSLYDAIYNLGLGVSEADCHAIVLEGEGLNDERIRELPLKKLVTGIRIDLADLGSQSRATSLEQLARIKDHVDYAVVSSRYVSKLDTLEPYFRALL